MGTKGVIGFLTCFAMGTTSVLAQTYPMSNASITACSGTFYDSGGSSGNYSINENLTITFTSSGGNCLSFHFTSFQTQAGNDILTIYDGPSTSSPVIGNFSGNVSPGTIESSTSSLTFHFVSNGSTNKLGWAATISCAGCAPAYLMNGNSTFNTCDGLFYDSGGAAGNYSANENYVQTFCSDAGNCVVVNFYSLRLAAGDTLKIYDGPTTASTLIGAYSGTTTPTVLLAKTGCLTFNMKSDGSVSDSGWVASISCELCPTLPDPVATYMQPTVGLANSYLGGPMVADCGVTYTDNGNTTGNYANGVTLDVYQTFCPSQANSCLRAQFFSVHMKSSDKLKVMNGPTYDSPIFPGTANLNNKNCSSYEACMSQGIGPFVSNDQSGCITFILNTTSSANDSGWVATLDCVPCLSGQTGLDNNDCQHITPLCNSTSFSDASTGPGLISDVDDNCLITETYTNWYSFKVASTGTLGMTIDPNDNSDDYDWAVYGPNASCGSLGNPIRCSTATVVGTNGNTGMSSSINLSQNSWACGWSNSGSDVNEDACGNGWVDDLSVSVGQIYYLCVSKWSPGGSGFTLSWTLTNGSSLSCDLLPVELTSFECHAQNGMILLNWQTASEMNNDHFVVERSADGENFEELFSVTGKRFSSETSDYFGIDRYPFPSTNYYRLKQVDVDGHTEILKTTACEVPADTEPLQLQVFDLSGKLLHSAMVEKADVMLKLSSLSFIPGVYLVVCTSGNGDMHAFKYLKAE